MTDSEDKDSLMHEDTRQLLVGVLATLIGAAALAALGALFRALRLPLTLPLWGYLTILTLVLVGAWGVVYLAQRQHRDQVDGYRRQAQLVKDEAVRQAQVHAAESQALEQRIRVKSDELETAKARERDLDKSVIALQDEIRQRDEMHIVDGLYYRATDTDHKQPFCRICWEGDVPKAKTVVRIFQERSGHWSYYCEWCEQSHRLPASFADGLHVDDDDIPF